MRCTVYKKRPNKNHGGQFRTSTSVLVLISFGEADIRVSVKPFNKRFGLHFEKGKKILVTTIG